MKNNIAYKFYLRPNCSQKVLIAKTFGCARLVYNLILQDSNDYYKLNGKSKRFSPAMYKEKYDFLKEVDSLALANAQLNVETAIKNYIKGKGKVGKPKFKSKKHPKRSYTTNSVNGNIDIDDNKIKLPKLGWVKIKVHREIPENYTIKSVTISRDPDERYYASILFECDDAYEELSDITTHIGLDYASNGLYIDSEGNFANMPHFYRNGLKRLKVKQRKLSRKNKDSNNYRKAKLAVAKYMKHIANQRKDFLHKESYRLCKLYSLISVEDLKMEQIAKLLHLAKATYGNAYFMFCCMMEYKQRRLGHRFAKVDKRFPSSQLCHNCGYKNPITKDLSVRKVKCPNCGIEYNRDINAAINIDKEGLRIASM